MKAFQLKLKYLMFQAMNRHKKLVEYLAGHKSIKLA